jgi:mannose-1-phosphate guanylyltransferase/mannose-6-phosphate isomerase
MAAINCVVLCGGNGTRLWPMSREKLPKQFLPLVNERTMFQNTVLRFKKWSSRINKFIFICNHEHSFVIERQYDEIDMGIQYEIIAEPIGRDTAAAVAVAALYDNKNIQTLVLPSDHVFNDELFINALETATPFVKNNKLVLLGIRPTYPATGYGYIEVDNIMNDVYTTKKFVEKPNYETACSYITTAYHMWNAGVFFFNNSFMISQYEKYAPDILDQCKKAIDASTVNGNIRTLSSAEFSACRAISVDYAIMEHVCGDQHATEPNCVTVPYKDVWCDVGSYESLHEYILSKHTLDDRYKGSNVTIGDVMLHNTHECYVHSEKALTVTVGVKDLVVVNTDDALLICDKSNTQDIKHVVQRLKGDGRSVATIHSKCYRPWGWYHNIEGNDHSGFKVKRICVYPGKRLSLQSHDRRSEHWVIVKGNARVQIGDDFLDLHPNQHVYIPKKTLHRMENLGDQEIEFIETQIGDYLGEDDIVRYQDDFGRA